MRLRTFDGDTFLCDTQLFIGGPIAVELADWSSISNVFEESVTKHNGGFLLGTLLEPKTHGGSNEFLTGPFKSVSRFCVDPCWFSANFG